MIVKVLFAPIVSDCATPDPVFGSNHSRRVSSEVVSVISRSKAGFSVRLRPVGAVHFRPEKTGPATRRNDFYDFSIGAIKIPERGPRRAGSSIRQTNRKEKNP